MQVIAQTEVPVSPSFMHLGYVSAVQTENRMGGFAGFLIVGAVLLYVLQRKSWVVKTAVVVAVVAASVVLFATIPPGKPRYPEMATAAWVRDVYQGITVLQERGEQVPGNVRQLRDRSGAPIEHLKDGWDRDFQITTYKETGRTRYRVISAGKDGKFDTADDICFPERPGERNHNVGL